MHASASKDTGGHGAEVRGEAAFVLCAEAGPLEAMTVRAVSSLRSFGGVLSNAPVTVVKPRRGPKLDQSTLRSLEQLEVDFVDRPRRDRRTWHSYFNKVHALRIAQERTDASTYVWLDSDVLVANEPRAVLLDEGFAAVPRDKNVGTDGADSNASLWKHMCKLIGVDLANLPMTRATSDGASFRQYFNAGVFAYAANTNFADEWGRDIDCVMRAVSVGYATKHQWFDQIILGLTAHRLGLPIVELSGEYNFGMASHFNAHIRGGDVSSARVIHYHDSMSGSWAPEFQRWLAVARPDLAKWLRELPIKEVVLSRRQSTQRDVYRVGRRVLRAGWGTAVVQNSLKDKLRGRSRD